MSPRKAPPRTTNSPVQVLSLLGPLPYKAVVRTVRDKRTKYFWLELTREGVEFTRTAKQSLAKSVVRLLKKQGIQVYRAMLPADKRLYVFYDPAYSPPERQWRKY